MAVKNPVTGVGVDAGSGMAKQSAIKVILGLILATLAAGFALLIYFSYRAYTNPEHVYGTWIEIGTPVYNTDTLTLNNHGVFKNGRLIATQYDFTGKRIYVETGSGISIYEMAGTERSPQLKRLQPNSPTQRFIKQGFEHTIDRENGGPAKNRRAALSDHFGGD